MSPRSRTVSCPTCGRTVRWSVENRWRPFCSERCRLIDLGAWLDGGRAIAGEPAPDGTPMDPAADPDGSGPPGH